MRCEAQSRLILVSVVRQRCKFDAGRAFESIDKLVVESSRRETMR